MAATHSSGSRGATDLPEFEETLWRALGIFRLATFAYAVALTARNFGSYDRPVAGWAAIAAMAAWTGVTIGAYARKASFRQGGRGWPMLAADFAVTASLLLSSHWVIGPALLSTGMATIPITWMVCPVIAVAVARGRRWGAAAALAMGACDIAVRGGIDQARLTGTVVMLVVAVVVAYLARLAADVEDRLRCATEWEAATRERERLARRIHDSVLQVLALVQRRGAVLGGEAAELGRLAGEQEAALRMLVSASGAASDSDDRTDLRAELARHMPPSVSLAAPAQPVWLARKQACELAAATAAALDNTARHAGPDARAWVLVEEEPEAVTVTVRDDGVGIASGRLESAAAEGRLGVTQAITGRISDIGGSAVITSRPGQGTEVEMRVPQGERK